jgi:hypothetical protein
VPVTEATRLAYSTDDPAVLAAYRQAKAARHEFSQRLLRNAAAIGHNLGPLSYKKPNGGEEIVGLRPDDSGIAPEGWHLTNQGKRLAPRIDRRGDVARRWLSLHQPDDSTDALAVLKDHGLVAQSRVTSGGSYACYRPALFEYDGRLWVCYRGNPENDDEQPTQPTWPPVPLEECLAALARAEAAPTAHLN